MEANDLVVAAVLSGNRNFEGRIHPLARASYLASPPLVVAFALAGRVDTDLTTEPLGFDDKGEPVFLVRRLAVVRGDPRRSSDRPSTQSSSASTYATVFDGDDRWRALPIPSGDRYAWEDDSTYIAKPPFFDGLGFEAEPVRDIVDARVLAVLGDSVTTDHISPAGSIAPTSPAGQWLQAHGVGPLEFNSYGARRGQHEVMMRGTFANIRLRNALADGREGPYTIHLPDGEPGFIYDTAMRYGGERRPAHPARRAGIRLGLVAGLGRQGTGPARSEGGHRRVVRTDPSIEPGRDGHPAAPVRAGRQRRVARPDRPRGVFDPGSGGRACRRASPSRSSPATRPACERRFSAIARLDGPIDVEYYRAGGILPAVLRRLAAVR